jgi:hypothetical protein
VTKKVQQVLSSPPTPPVSTVDAAPASAPGRSLNEVWRRGGPGMGEMVFRVALTIDRLSNAPFNHSRLFVKWKTPSHKSQGCTRISEVRDHTCVWADTVTFEVKLKVDKTNTLCSHLVRFSVREASPTCGTEEFKRQGIAEFDLAAVARIRESFHRVLLQKTKATEALHFSIEMQQLSGAPTFRCPPLPQGIQDVVNQTVPASTPLATPLKQQPTSDDPMAEVLRQANSGIGRDDRDSRRSSLSREPSLLRSPADASPAASTNPTHRRGASSEVVVDSVFAAVFGDGAGKAERSEPEPDPQPDSDR